MTDEFNILMITEDRDDASYEKPMFVAPISGKIAQEQLLYFRQNPYFENCTFYIIWDGE